MKRCLLSLLPLIPVACTVPRASSSIETSARAPAPSFTLLDTEGVERSLSDYRGKVVVLNFWAPWCFTCKDELKALTEVRDHFSGSDFEVLAVTVLEGGQKLPRLHYPFPVLLDTGKAAAKAYEIGMLPVTHIIDKHGRIAELPDPAGGKPKTRFEGPRGWNALGTVRALETLLKE